MLLCCFLIRGNVKSVVELRLLRIYFDAGWWCLLPLIMTMVQGSLCWLSSLVLLSLYWLLGEKTSSIIASSWRVTGCFRHARLMICMWSLNGLRVWVQVLVPWQASVHLLMDRWLAFVSLADLLLRNGCSDRNRVLGRTTRWAIIICFFLNVLGRLSALAIGLLLGRNAIDSLSELHLLLWDVSSFDFCHCAGDFWSFARYLHWLVYPGAPLSWLRLRMRLRGRWM